MENVIGIRIVDGLRGEAGLLSWGRIGDPVDATAFLVRVRQVLPMIGFRDVVEISVCDSLRELQTYRYFYEGLVQFSAEYAEVLGGRRTLAALEHDDEALRKSLYVLGPPSRHSRA